MAREQFFDRCYLICNHKSACNMSGARGRSPKFEESESISATARRGRHLNFRSEMHVNVDRDWAHSRDASRGPDACPRRFPGDNSQQVCASVVLWRHQICTKIWGRILEDSYCAALRYYVVANRDTLPLRWTTGFERGRCCT